MLWGPRLTGSSQPCARARRLTFEIMSLVAPFTTSVEPKRARSWSIARRTTWWFGLTTAAIVLAICAISGVFLTRSAEQQIDARIEEELEEFVAAFKSSDQSHDAVEKIVASLAEHHSSNPMAWRLWDTDTGAIWGEFGHTELMTAGAPARVIGSEASALPGALRWRSMQLTDHRVVGLMLNGSEQMAMVSSFGAVSVLLAIMGGLIAFAAGAVFIRRSCRLLRGMGDKVRNVHVATGADDLDMPDAPDEIRDMVEALQQALTNIRSEVDRARLMTTGLAHELGLPLQNLIGETEVALLSERTPDEYKNVLRSHLEDLRDLGHAVGNLMTLCTLESGASSEVENFDLGRESELRLRREYAHAERQGVRLEVVHAGDLSLSGDREALLLAVGNIVANAIDWTPAGKEVSMSLSGSDGRVHVTVDDGGPGVSDDERSKIFQPFYSGAAACGKRAGYGLGLSIAKKAVEAQGGSLEVARSPQGGARFALHLPRARRSEH